MNLQQAKEHLGDIVDDKGNLYSLGWYLCYNVGDNEATLDGKFTLKDLEAIVVCMRASQEAVGID